MNPDHPTTALVTGGGGFLGGRIVDMLREQGCRVRILGRNRYPACSRDGVEGIVGDVRDPAILDKACHGVDVVFHAAAIAGVWGPPQRYHQINTEGTRHVVAACVRQGVPRLVHTSSPSVVFADQPIENGDESLSYPPTFLAPYPASKAAAEQIVLGADGTPLQVANPASDRLLTCAIRPHLIYGPGDPHIVPRLIRSACKGRLIQVGDGTNKVDITYVDNAAQAHIQAADHLRPGSPVCGRAYFVGDESPVVLWDWIQQLTRQCNVPGIRRAVSYPTARRMAALVETVHRLFPFLGEPPMTRFVAAQLGLSHWFSHDAARRDFGYVPKVSPEQALDALVKWVLQTRLPQTSDAG